MVPESGSGRAARTGHDLTIGFDDWHAEVTFDDQTVRRRWVGVGPGHPGRELRRGPQEHLRGLGALEDQMCQMTVRGFEGRGSPDRLDALVWAIHELVIEPGASWRRPQMRRL